MDQRLIDAQQTILAAMLQDEAALYELAGALTPEHFTSSEAALAFATLADAARAGKRLDYLAASQALKAQGEPGAAQWLASAYTAPCSEGLLSEALFHLQQHKQRRDLVALMKAAYREMEEGADPLAVASRLVDDTMRVFLRDPETEVLDSDAALDEFYRALDERRERQLRGERICLPLGLPRLSRILSVEPGHLQIIAAMTGRGKTSLALNMAHHLGWLQRVPCLYLNTEMSLYEIMTRLVGIAEGKRVTDIRLAATEEAMAAAYRARERFSAGKLLVSRELPDLDSARVTALVRRYRASHRIEAVFVDYIQRLADASGDRERAGWEALIQIAKRLKTLAQQTGVAIFMIAQLNNEGELARSSQMKAEADGYMTLERLDYEDRQRFGATHRLVIRKNRHGLEGAVLLHIDENTLQVREVDGQWETSA
ncbi:MAG: DnaB-like helicase C-terminal domain-containing protein [Actinomycetes bacterium]